MAERLEVYKCALCGNIVEVLHGGDGSLVCCGEPMKLMVGNTVDASREKHIPVIEKTAGGYKVSVGSIPHPMEEKHYIEWIELVVLAADGSASEIYRKYLKPGDAPQALFAVSAASVLAREYCNLHGQWIAAL